MPIEPSDRAPAPEDYRARTRPRFHGATRTSLYLPMRDGVRIAVDVHLPRGAGHQRLPTILRQTRYYRGFDAPASLTSLVSGEALDPVNAGTRSYFLSHGYAWVDVDVRGSGASFGTWPYPWAPAEVRDGAEVVEWVVRQPWSSGRVGATGVSYDGTAAEMLLSTGHPAVRAVAPRFSLFDVYADVAYPGGLPLAWFTDVWSRANDALDRNNPSGLVAEVVLLGLPGAARRSRRLLRAALARSLKTVLRGARPVDADTDGAQRDAAVRAHEDNGSVHVLAQAVTFRDDPHPRHPDETVAVFSPSGHRDALDGAGAAVFGASGWFDGAYPNAAVRRHLAMHGPDRRLLLGPWTHGGRRNCSPGAGTSRVGFDHDAELLRFFDLHLRGLATGFENEAPVRYFTMDAETWRASETWPPPEASPRRFHLGAARALRERLRPVDDGSDVHRVDVTAGTGERSRWRGLMSPFVPADYPGRRRADARNLVYTTAPLERDLEVTGHPVVTLHVTLDTTDGAFFAYLEDVGPDGEVRYVTEGQLRALHRKYTRAPGAPVPARSFLRADAWPLVPGEVAEITLDLLPVSYRFRQGHCVRLSLAGADRDHFAVLPGAAPTWEVYRGRGFPSHVELPVIDRPTG